MSNTVDLTPEYIVTHVLPGLREVRPVPWSPTDLEDPELGESCPFPNTLSFQQGLVFRLRSCFYKFLSMFHISRQVAQLSYEVLGLIVV